MRKFLLKGVASYLGSGLWWLTQRLYGDAIFSWLLPKIPAAILHPVFADSSRWLLSYGPPAALFILGTWFFINANNSPPPPVEDRGRIWPVHTLISYLIAQTWWGWRSRLRLNYIEAVEHQAPAEFRRAALAGEIQVSGRLPNTLESTEIDRNYWRHARLRDDLTGTDIFGDGSIYPPLRCYSDLTVAENDAVATWPRINFLASWIFAIGIWLKLKWMLSPFRERLKKVQPIYVIILGLVIAGIGAGWQLYRGMQPTVLSRAEIDKMTAPFQAQIDALSKQINKPFFNPAPIIPDRPPTEEPLRATKANGLTPPYNDDELGRMIKMTGALTDIILGPAEDAYNAGYNLTGWQRIQRESGTAGLANAFDAARVKMVEVNNDINAVINADPRFRSEMFPTVEDKDNGFSEAAGTLGEIKNDLSELSKGQGINLERFLTSPLQKLEQGIQKYGHWRDVSIKRLSDTMKELRALKASGQKPP